jgi:hypothetical protein
MFRSVQDLDDLIELLRTVEREGAPAAGLGPVVHQRGACRGAPVDRELPAAEGARRHRQRRPVGHLLVDPCVLPVIPYGRNRRAA